MEVKYCVVCGQGSTRQDWQGKDVVACDNHSKEEVAAATKAKKVESKTVPTPTASAPPPAQPNNAAAKSAS